MNGSRAGDEPALPPGGVDGPAANGTIAVDGYEPSHMQAPTNGHAAPLSQEATRGEPSRRVRANPARRRPRSGGEADPTPAGDQPRPAAPTSNADNEVSATGDSAAPSEPGAAPDRAGSPSRGEDRRVERLRQRQEAKTKRQETAKAQPQAYPSITYEEGQAAHVSMVRHVNSLTVALNEAHRIIGRLNMEKHQAQRELAIAKKLPLPPPLPDPSWSAGASRSGPLAVRQLQRNRSEERKPAPDPTELAELKTTIVRRRIAVLGAVALVAAIIVGYRMLGWNWFPDISDRDAMTQLAGVGAFVQIFFVGWMVFRFARIGGKGARWLFPDVEEEHRKRARKQRR